MDKPAFIDLIYEGKSLKAAPFFEGLINQGLVSFSFTDTKKKMDKFQLGLEGIPVDAADTLLIEEDDEVTLVFGVGDWQISRIMLIDEVSFTYGETVNAAITGRGEATKLQECGGKVWLGKTDSEIAHDIALLYGFTPQITDTTEVRPQLAQGARTYAQLLDILAEENDFVFKMENGILQFRPRGENNPPVTTLYYGTGQSPYIEDLSIASKRTRVKSGGKVAGTGKDKGKSGAAGAGDEKAVVMSGFIYNGTQNAETGPSLPGAAYSVSGFQLTSPTFGTLTDEPITGGTGTKQHTPGGTKEEVKKRAEAKAAKILWKAVEATCSTRDIKIAPTEKVNIAGIAKKHSGAYYCDEVTYTLDGNSFKVSLKLKNKPFPTKKSAKTDKDKDGKSPGKGEKNTDSKKDNSSWVFGKSGKLELGKI